MRISRLVVALGVGMRNHIWRRVHRTDTTWPSSFTCLVEGIIARVKVLAFLRFQKLDMTCTKRKHGTLTLSRWLTISFLVGSLPYFWYICRSSSLSFYEVSALVCRQRCRYREVDFLLLRLIGHFDFDCKKWPAISSASSTTSICRANRCS